MTIIGMAGILCFSPSCKKSDVKPQGSNNQSTQHQAHEEMAKLYVMIDSKSCETPQSEYTSATIDIRSIQVNNGEHGWEDLTPVPGAWDVVSLQTAPVPVAEITEVSTVHTGTITQIKLIIGDNNKLVVNDAAAKCYNVEPKEIILDLKGELRANTVNEIVISVDICGKFTVHTKYDEEPCYTLKPVMAFQSFSTTAVLD
ncbi:MAG: hypothetical protein K0S12_1292 [Bacteroidetes bacterium]|nr:hypothetical protein [Bacteroidota bacterium]